MSPRKLTDSMSWEQIVEKCYIESEIKDTGFKKWMQSKKDLGDYFFGPSKHWAYCYKVLKKLKGDDDHVEVICGQEGSGKSTLAIQRACMVDPSFCRERIFNSRLEMIRWLKMNHGKTRGKAIVIDEGNLLIFNRESQSSGNVNLIKMFALCRQANLYIIICVPSFLTLDSYLRKHRVEAMCWITKKHKHFTHYSKKALMIINEVLRKGVGLKEIKVPIHLLFNGYWNKELPNMNDITDKDYRALKDRAWKEFLDTTEQALAETEKGQLFIRVSQAAKMMDISKDTIIKLIKEKKLTGKLLGGQWVVHKASMTDCSLFEAVSAPPLLLSEQVVVNATTTIET